VKANVLFGMNCSLSPSPFSIASAILAQQTAKVAGIGCTLRMSQQTISGYLLGNGLAAEIHKDNTFTHMLLGCDDLAFSEDAIVKLVNDDKDIVTGVYRRRGDDNSICACLFQGDTIEHHINEKDLAEVVYCPGHMMLVKKKVIDDLYEAFPDTEYKDQTGEMVRGLFMPFVANGLLYLDDYGFSARARSRGFTCWIDFSVRFRHRWYVWLDVPEHVEEKKE
jgi:hypothetical protein